MSERLRIGYVYRDFNRDGSLHSFYVDRVERLSRDEDVLAVCSSHSRVATDAPVRFATVEPVVRGRGRLAYAAETGSFAVRATRLLRRVRNALDVVHVVGYSALEGDLVTVNAVRAAEVEHYFGRVEPEAPALRRRLASLLRPQTGVAELIEHRLFRSPMPLCLTETKAIADDLERWYGVSRDLIEVLPAGVDRSTFFVRPDRRSPRGGPLVVLFVGDDFERKGLARAVAAVARSRSEPLLLVAGGGDPTPYDELARTLGCAGRVRFLGRVEHEQLPAQYAAADVLLLPSLQDAWGQPVLEAAACGVPSIVSGYTGAREIVEDGVSGFVVAGAGDPAEIAAVLDGPLAAAERRQAAGRRAAEIAATFDRELLYERLRAAHHRAHRRRLERLGAAA